MVRLARAVVCALVEDAGPEGVLRRVSDPFWFQAFGCVLGFDWHSSGLTTTVCGALKQGLRGLERDLGLAVAGGKGRASRRTPEELRAYGEWFGFAAERLVYASRTSAKVDNHAVQDGYQLYHHALFVTRGGAWAVAARHAGDRPHRPEVPLARRGGVGLRVRAARRGVRGAYRAHPEPGGPGECERTAGHDGAVPAATGPSGRGGGTRSRAAHAAPHLRRRTGPAAAGARLPADVRGVTGPAGPPPSPGRTLRWPPRTRRLPRNAPSPPPRPAAGVPPPR